MEKPKTKDDWESYFKKRFGKNYLGSVVERNQFPCVFVGNPDQEIIIDVYHEEETSGD